MSERSKQARRQRQRLVRAVAEAESKKLDAEHVVSIQDCYNIAILEVGLRAEADGSKYRFNHVKDLTPFNVERIENGGTVAFK